MSGFGDRLNWAFLQLQVREGRTLERSEIGRRVARRLGRKAAYTSQSVGSWLDKTEPSFRVTRAIADEMGVDPGWLAFGDATRAPAPAGWEPSADPRGPAALPITDDVTQLRALKSARQGLDASAEIEAGERADHPTRRRRRAARGKRPGSGSG